MTAGELCALLERVPDDTQLSAQDPGDDSVGIFGGTWAVVGAMPVFDDDADETYLVLQLEV